jgi:hypothetical protein
MVLHQGVEALALRRGLVEQREPIQRPLMICPLILQPLKLCKVGQHLCILLEAQSLCRGWVESFEEAPVDLTPDVEEERGIGSDDPADLVEDAASDREAEKIWSRFACGRVLDLGPGTLEEDAERLERGALLAHAVDCTLGFCACFTCVRVRSMIVSASGSAKYFRAMLG